jgi:hypothetical protein
MNLQHFREFPNKFEIFWPSGSWEDFSMNQLHFLIFEWFLIWTNLDSFRDLITWQFVLSLIETGLLTMEKIYKFSVYLYYFTIIFPWTRHWSTFKLDTSLFEDDLSQIWLKLAQWLWRWSKKKPDNGWLLHLQLKLAKKNCHSYAVNYSR